MNQSFYIGAVGAQQQQQRMNLHGNNIANVNSHGFKAEKGRFSNLMYRGMRAIEQEEAMAGTGAALWTSATDFSTGALGYTGRSQDYAIEGDGFFALADLATGEVSLTRNGAFMWASLERPSGQVDANGNLLTDEAGNPLTELIYYLSDGQGRFVLSETGGMIELADGAYHQQQPVGIYDHINYNGMEHLEDTRFLAVEKNGALRLGTGKLLWNTLEGSNVDLAEEMTKVIESQRAYSLALKVVTTSDEIEETINGLSR